MLRRLLPLLILCTSLAAAEPSAITEATQQKIKSKLDAAIADGDLPGAVILFGTSTEDVFRLAYGHRSLEPTKEPMTADTLFDLASLTKPIATASSIMVLMQDGKLHPDDKVAKHLPEFAQNGKGDVTIAQLLTHTSGLTPDNKLTDYDDGPEQAWERIFALPLHSKPGEKFAYSDVGYLVLGKIVERVSGQSLDEFAEQHVFRPLEMSETGFAPIPERRTQAAPTGERNGDPIRGEVHDPRAHRLGGVAGHTGLFSTAGDLAKYARHFLPTPTDAPARSPLDAKTRDLMTADRHVPGGGVRTYGWDRKTGYSMNGGSKRSPQAFGHGGFTGTVMWIDPTRDVFFIFLSNRHHPNGSGSVNRLAGEIFDLLPVSSIAGAVDSRLEKPISIALDDVSLSDALSRLSAQLGLPITIDEASSIDGGVDADSIGVSLFVEDCPAQVALNLLLVSTGLAYRRTAEGLEVLAVGLGSDHRRRLYRTQPYAVHSLLKKLQRSRLRAAYADPARVWLAPHIRDESDTLADLAELARLHASGLWLDIDGDEGTATLLGGHLVVRQSEVGHTAIEQFLAALERSFERDAAIESVLRSPSTQAWHHTLREKLQSPVTFVAKWESRQQLLERIERGFAIPLDLNAFGVVADLDTRETFRHSQASLASLLERIIGHEEGVTVSSFGMVVPSTEDISTIGQTRIYRLNVDSADRVTEVFESTVDSWQATDGFGGAIYNISPTRLVVWQTPAVHAEIEALLRKLDLLDERDGPTPTHDPEEIIRRPYRFATAADAQQQAEHLPQFVTPDEWEDAAIMAVGKVLFVRQKRRVHEAIVEWLLEIEAEQPKLPDLPAFEIDGTYVD